MRRSLFIVASALLMLLCMAAGVLWVRSYFYNDRLGRLHYSPGVLTEDHHLWVETNRGMLRVNWGGDPIGDFSAVRWELRHLPADPSRSDYQIDEPRLLSRIGIGWERNHPLLTGETSAGVRVHLGLPALASAFVAALCPPRTVRACRKVGGTACVVCGYDLRATPDRCPECGIAVVKPMGQ